MEIVKSVYETLNEMTRPTSLSEYVKHVVKWNNVAAFAKGGFTTFEKQMTFVEEELKETLDALRIGDKVEVVDGACDFLVVASYARYLRSDKIEHELYRYNNKCFSPGLAIDALNRGDTETLIKQSVSLIFSLDFNIHYNMMQVLSSNDSKYPTEMEIKNLYDRVTLDEALRQECLAIEDRSKGRYTGVHCKKVLSYELDGTTVSRIVFFDNTGKIMKPSTFVKPKIIV